MSTSTNPIAAVADAQRQQTLDDVKQYQQILFQINTCQGPKSTLAGHTCPPGSLRCKLCNIQLRQSRW